MHSELTTDLSIIYSNLNLNNSKLSKENIVLIKTGALNPIHRSHISNMIKTKQYLENVHGFNVIGGFISPAHDDYVKNKLGEEFISSQHRIQMCQKAIQEENQQHWLTVDKAESMAPHFVSLALVTESLQTFLNQKFTLENSIRVIYVAGLDLFNCCSGFPRLRKDHMGGVAVVYRYGQDQSLIQSIINQNNSSKVYFISLEDQSHDISSTLIRQKLQTNEDCSSLTYKSVLEYLQMTPINK